MSYRMRLETEAGRVCFHRTDRRPDMSEIHDWVEFLFDATHFEPTGRDADRQIELGRPVRGHVYRGRQQAFGATFTLLEDTGEGLRMIDRLDNLLKAAK